MSNNEGNVLFNDALNTFYLRLYGVTPYLVKDHFAREETRCCHMGYSFRLAARVLLYAPSHRIAHTTVLVTPVMEHWLEREIAQWVHPTKDRSDDPSHHERTLLPRSYISLHQSWSAGWNASNNEAPTFRQVEVADGARGAEGGDHYPPLVEVFARGGAERPRVPPRLLVQSVLDDHLRHGLNPAVRVVHSQWSHVLFAILDYSMKEFTDIQVSSTGSKQVK